MASNQQGLCALTPGSASVTFQNAQMTNMTTGDFFRLINDSTFYTIAGINTANMVATLGARYRNPTYEAAILNEQFDTGDGGKNYSGTLSNLPIIPGTVVASDQDNVEVFTDNGAGTLVGDGSGNGTINYDTGAISVHFTTNISGGKQILADSYSYGLPMSGMNFQIVRDYTTYFSWPEPSPTDQNQATITKQALMLADSDLRTYGAQTFTISVFDSDVNVAIGNGKKAFCIPFCMNGLVLTDAVASVHDKGTTNTTDIQIRRRRNGSDADMLQTKITIGDEFYARDGVIDTANDDVATGDQIYIDVDAIHSTAPKGLSVTLVFQK